MNDRYSVIRNYKEVKRVVGVDHYTMDVRRLRITFYDDRNVVIADIPAEVGDVVTPFIIGFHNPFPPIDQSEARIRELTEQMTRLNDVSGGLGLPLV